MRRWWLMGLLLVAVIVRADVLHPELILNKVQLTKSSEKGGDEIYLHITEFQSTGKHRQYTIPNYPLHWPSSALDQVKDLSIWKQSLNPGESVEVIVSVVEQDMQPWNTDDLIGTLKLRVQNKDSKLKYDWAQVANGSAGNTTPMKKGTQAPLRIQGTDNSYDFTFQLLENNSAAMPVQDKAKPKS